MHFLSALPHFPNTTRTGSQEWERETAVCICSISCYGLWCWVANFASHGLHFNPRRLKIQKMIAKNHEKGEDCSLLPGFVSSCDGGDSDGGASDGGVPTGSRLGIGLPSYATEKYPLSGGQTLKSYRNSPPGGGSTLTPNPVRK
jgi:hypothetical protein